MKHDVEGDLKAQNLAFEQVASYWLNRRSGLLELRFLVVVRHFEVVTVRFRQTVQRSVLSELAPDF
jgi:hypothetical protein